MSENRTYTFGAMPPPGMEWQTGKTAATIQWVKYLETQYRETGDPLFVVVQALKDGTLVANKFPPK